MIFSVRIPFAYQVEQWVHEKCRSIRVEWFKGSGRTERFLFPAVIPAIFASGFIFLMEWVIALLIIAAFGYAVLNSSS